MRLLAYLLARIAVDFAHRGASGVVGCKPPVDAVVAVHATGKEVESFVVHVFLPSKNGAPLESLASAMVVKSS